VPRLFLLHGAARKDPEVDRWFAEDPSQLKQLAAKWFEHLRRCGDDVCVIMHDGCPTACVGEAAFAYVGVYKAHVNLGFFPGAELNDPAGLLQGTGKFMRHVKLRPGEPVDTAALERLIHDAYEVTRNGFEVVG
jgi:hypothetical protein